MNAGGGHQQLWSRGPTEATGLPRCESIHKPEGMYDSFAPNGMDKVLTSNT